MKPLAAVVSLLLAGCATTGALESGIEPVHYAAPKTQGPYFCFRDKKDHADALVCLDYAQFMRAVERRRQQQEGAQEQAK